MWLHPEIRSVPDIARYWSARIPDKTAIEAGEVRLTYRELEQVTNRIGATLSAAGHARRNLCFIGTNIPEFWTLWIGAGKAACPFVPLNWRCTVFELVELIADAQPAIIFADSEYAEIMKQVVERLDSPVELVVFDSEATGGDGLSPWLCEGTEQDPRIEISGTDVALLNYTSGTTGVPKGVMIRHESFSFAALSDELEPTITHRHDDVNLMVMPNFHLAGSWVSLPTLYHGGTLVLIPAFEATAVLAAIEKYRPTTVCLVPTAIQALLDAAASSTADLTSLRTLIYCGSPISAATIERALALLRCELRQFYGTTEAYIITILRPDDHDPSQPEQLASCGSPIPLVKVRVTDSAGNDLPDGEIGHVVVRSPMIMSGYYGRPDETARTIRDGWYWTGDLGYRDARGLSYLVDRAKDMIVSGGENIYSVEVERALLRHPHVEMAAVVGTPDPRWGEAVTAYVVPKPGTALDSEELQKHCRELIAAYKVPKRIHVETELPLTPTGKIRKVELRQREQAIVPLSAND